MNLYPAIDLLGGRCVRLFQGDYDQETVYAEDPLEQALAFVDGGAQWLHMVDLDAAKSGEATNSAAIARVCEAVSIPVQVGGGVRSADAAARLADLGVRRVVIGTAALEQPSLVPEVAAKIPVAVGLDGRHGNVAIHGWTETSDQTVNDVAARFASAGAAAFVVTEISRDGTLEGPDLVGLGSLLRATDVPVIASGGVGELEHLEQLAQLEGGGRRLEGVITGKALYEHRFTVPEALSVLRQEPTEGVRV